MYLHALGVRLGKTIGELEQIPHSELIEWLAYFDLTSKK